MPRENLQSQRALAEAAHRLTLIEEDLDPLIDLAGDAVFVLLGEASHGTHEFYSTRTEITRRLIKEKGFQAVAVEADWPDAYRVNRYVRGRTADTGPAQALSGFTRFPVWMWRNRDVEILAAWLRHYNDSRPQHTPQVGFYGLDLYSMNRSRAEVVAYLSKIDPAAARRARERYSCFDPFGQDEQAYGYASGLDISDACRDEVVQQLVELQRRAYEYPPRRTDC
jgi:erythromycin esterase-like protein